MCPGPNFYRDILRKNIFVFIIFSFLECSGRLQEFYYNTTDFYGEKIVFPAAGLRLPLSHPFIVTIITILGSSFVIAPACYAKIYRYKYLKD